MKIICIGRNYTEHAKELGNDVPDEPVLFIKPETALNTSSNFEIPSFSDDIHFELELVLRISKSGKKIHEEDAHQYFNEIGLGIDFTARDVQSKLKAKGLPWEKAKAFDGSAVISDFISFKELKNKQEINFKLYQNHELKQVGNSSHMLFNFDQIIAHASQYFSLEKGDLILTGTPKGVGKINVGDVLTGSLEGKELLALHIS